MDYLSLYMLALSILMLQSAPGDKIHGKWKTVEDTNGFHFILEFFEDGSYSKTLFMESVEKYKVRGNHMHFGGNLIEPEVSKFRIEGDTLFLDTPKRVEKLIRQNKPIANAPPIVGIWKQKRAFEKGEEYSMIIEFKKDGRSWHYVELEHKKGTYKITGDKLITSMERPPLEQRFKIKNGFLIFDDGGSEDTFKRVRR